MCSEKQDPLYEAFVEWCREKGITPEQAGLLAKRWSLITIMRNLEGKE